MGLYELMWWMPIKGINLILRKNFGFMYKVQGKALYLIFIACLTMGLDKEVVGQFNWLRWFTGIAWGVGGVGLMFLRWTLPDLFEKYKPPTAGLDSTKADDNSEFNSTV